MLIQINDKFEQTEKECQMPHATFLLQSFREAIMYKYAILSTVSILLAGCVTTQPQAQRTFAQIEQDRVTSTLRDVRVKLQSCLDDVKKTESYRRFHDEILFEADDSQNRFVLLANKGTYNREQIDFVIATLPTITKCRGIMSEGYRGTPFHTTVLRHHNESDLLYIKVIRGDVSISEANQEKARLLGRWKTEWAESARDFDTKLRQMHEAEIAGRRQAANEMWSVFMQQQQIQQAQQQQLYQQQMQYFNSRPVLSNPTTTTCNNIFNQLVCTTR
jgi:hypothetical protein